MKHQYFFSLSYRMEWEADMKKYLKELEKTKPVIFCGDLNVAHNEIGMSKQCNSHTIYRPKATKCM